MKTIVGLMFFAIVFVAVSATAQATAFQGPTVVGSWDLTTESPQGARTTLLIVKKDGDKLSGMTKGARGELQLNSVTQKGSDVTFVMTIQFQGNDMVITYTGKLEKDSMKGEADFGGLASGTWSALPHKEGAMAGPPAAGGAAAGSASNISGVWDFVVETQAGSGTPVFTFKQDGETLTGNYKGQFGEAPLTGTVKGSDVKFTIKVNAQGQDLTIVYTGKVTGAGSMKGTAAIADLGEATWTAKKK